MKSWPAAAGTSLRQGPRSKKKRRSRVSERVLRRAVSQKEYHSSIIVTGGEKRGCMISTCNWFVRYVRITGTILVSIVGLYNYCTGSVSIIGTCWKGRIPSVTLALLRSRCGKRKEGNGRRTRDVLITRGTWGEFLHYFRFFTPG